MKWMLKSTMLLIGFSALALQAFAQEPDLSKSSVIVEDTGSTNFSGYRIVVDPSGVVNVTSHGRISINVIYPNGHYKVSSEVVHKLMDDLDTDMPLSALKSVACAKSASFGTSTFVTYKGQTSPDIKCLVTHKNFVDDVYNVLGSIHKTQ